jgi:hypothetical protein
MSHGILLVNLGTPASTATRDVRRYLNDFLMDPYVLDVPWPLRRLIVSAFILPFRPRRSAEAYAAIWDARRSGHRLAAAALQPPPRARCERSGSALRARHALRRARPRRRRGPPGTGRRRRAAAGAPVPAVRRLHLHHHGQGSQALTRGRMSLQVLTPFYARPDYIASAGRLGARVPAGALGPPAAELSRAAGTAHHPRRPHGQALPEVARLLQHRRPPTPAATATSATALPSASLRRWG